MTSHLALGTRNNDVVAASSFATTPSTVAHILLAFLYPTSKHTASAGHSPFAMSTPIDAPSAAHSLQRGSVAQTASKGQSTPLSSSVRFHQDTQTEETSKSIDRMPPIRIRRIDDDLDQHSSDTDQESYGQHSSSYNDSGRRSSSFGIATPSHGFPSSSAYHYKAMISKHGHGFPDTAESVRNISVLANLVDYRSNYYEDHRVFEEEIKHRTSHLSWSKASAVADYYERLNDTLDGWREVDEILDSRFPDEVMRRFNQQDERHRHNQHRHKPSHKPKRRNKQHPHNGSKSRVESDGNVSDEEETEGEGTRKSRRSLKRSFSAKAVDVFSGLWFGSSGSPRASDLECGRSSHSHRHHDHRATRARAFDLTSATEEEEEEQEDYTQGVPNLLSSSPSGMNGNRNLSGRRDYGATSASSAGQLYDKLRREGRIEQIRRSESQLALSSGAGTPAGASGTQTPSDDISSPASKANTIRPNQVENIPGDRTLTETQYIDSHLEGAKLVRIPCHEGSLDRDFSRERHHRPYASQEEERQALLNTVPNRAKEEETSRSVQFAININLLVNILLLAGKGFAVLSSNSVSLIASLVDSALDLLSTVIIFATSKAIAYRSWRTMYKYPVGKQRLEPLGVVIFSVLMIASFAQVLIESMGRLRDVLSSGSQDPDSASSLPLIGVAFMLATIGIKTVMWLLYRSSKSSGVRAVAQDAENDVVFNIASLIFPIVGTRLGWSALDPIGGIVLSMYIIYEWVETLWETVSKLSGAVASSTEISKCLYCVVRFNSVNSVSAFELFHSGDNLIVEADIVLPHSISLKESHDLGEIITYCTENIGGVERSYIHLDYNPKGQAGHLTQRG
ncbi:related to cation diffusion facilitator 10 [Melanopsichium pennsylvanicum]|uniref:Related to cation diffusion facilitator 10 n=2 Tax=Melanopsichium pennsylvanicum TaxID=63383 RepID=A0AAJ4XSW8_9BASI|nr:related to cation diffusion facilitator 10 [Melanopsichium pennsylvanicum 4]SNX88039.1 related to cation diffusion facilitator 10 [Melanopsichium pennsylvanicum]